MSFIVDLYRRYMPIYFRYKIGKIRIVKIENNNLKKVIDGIWRSQYPSETEYIVKRGKLLTLPYPFIEKYREKDIEVFIDNDCKMPFVLVDNKKLFFPKRYPTKYIRTIFNSLRTEQDVDSPHYYFDPKDERLRGGTFVDVGAAEGLISLKVVDYVDKLILLECDQDWIQALRNTFEPYKDKVTIINKFASDVIDERNITLDEVAKGCKKVVLKLDVEGMEKKVLNGAEEILAKSDTSVFVCTYHNPGDEVELSEYLERRGFMTEKSKGVMFYGYSDGSFRKAIIRASK